MPGGMGGTGGVGPPGRGPRPGGTAPSGGEPLGGGSGALKALLGSTGGCCDGWEVISPFCAGNVHKPSRHGSLCSMARHIAKRN